MTVRNHTVAAAATLDAFLAKVLAGARGKRLQQLLKFKSVSVNGRVVTRAKHALVPGDVVAIHFDPRPPPVAELPGGLRRVYEDEHLIVVDKPPGLLTMASANERARTAYALLTAYVRQSRPDARIFIVHRLDQGTSGLLLFARSEEVKRALQDGWKDAEKKYFAIVEGAPQPESDTITSRLQENRAMRVYSSDEGDLAVTRYRVLQKSRHRALLEVTLETGRKNQIRVHLADRGHPVAGDKKYGARTDPAGRLAPHACSLTFVHPIRGERTRLTSPLPPKLRLLVPTPRESPATTPGTKTKIPQTPSSPPAPRKYPAKKSPRSSPP